MRELNGSVGLGGRNLRDDVIAIQTLLKKNGTDPGQIDGVCGPKTIAAINSFQRRILVLTDGRVDPRGVTWDKLNGMTGAMTPTAGDWSGDSSKWMQEKKLQSLDPAFRGKVQLVLNTLRANGFQPKVFFGWRSVQVQEDLYNKGRSKVRFSFHNAQKQDGTPNAYAADIIDSRWGWEPAAKANGFWIALGKAAKEVGLVWGGDWVTFPDEAHVQSRQNSELAAVL